MKKSDVEWEFESGCRVAMNYAGYRYAFFSKLNVSLAIISLASLWLSGFIFAGDHKIVSAVLNIVGSVSLIFDVVLNIKGSNSYWSAMYDGYNAFFSEFIKIQPTSSVEELQELKSRFVEFDGKCNANFNALGLIAWNDACVQMGRAEHVKHIPWYKRWTANLFSWGSVADNFT